MAAVLVIAASQGFGWTQFKDGGTYNIYYTINDDVWVDYQRTVWPPTTVNLLNGGNIPSPYKLQGYNDGRINIFGGSVSYSLYAYNSSHITMLGGTVDEFLGAYDSSQVTMSGGSVGNQLLANNSQVTMSGGSVRYDLFARNSSQVTITGGLVNRDLFADNNSLVNWSGGTVGGRLLIGGVAILVINGSNFAIEGISVGFGEIEIASILGGDCFNEPSRRLTGRLANGDIINNQFQIGNDAKIVLGP
jgi:hypothetical protein